MKKIKRVEKDPISSKKSRDSVKILKSNKQYDKDDIIRPRFRKLNTPMGPSRFVPLSTLREIELEDESLPEPSKEYVDYETLKPSNIEELKNEVSDLVEENSLTLEEAADLLDKAYGPERIFVWFVKIIIFNAFMLGTLGFAMSFPNTNSSLPSFTLWSACTVGFASFVSLFGCIFIAFSRRVVELRVGTFMHAINSGLSMLTSVSVLWFFYGLLTIGKKDSPTIINNLSKLLWPLTFPLQGAPFVIGASFIIVLFLLFLVTSYKSTPVNGSNRIFINHGFLFMASFMKAFIQIMSNRGYVVCDLRGNPWAGNANTIYSLWNRSYAIWITVNSLLAISFLISLIGDLKLDKRLGPVNGKYFPYARVVHSAFISIAYLGFMLFDVRSSQGTHDIIQASTSIGRTMKKEKAFHTIYNFCVLGLCALTAVMDIDWFHLVINDRKRSGIDKDKFHSTQMEYKKEQ
ncbi:hypothetical protein GUITHDRAFT_146686 [Guillardia theta CCMP2712]|uniref:Uncharacterized protein n=1 Tax=Guillardia theta (strain CCMP2712) TaxID=905079 RepID=L1IGG9_GUITC|nr:hypothetical protein GUITHDRAFT_146686 [Guillardia theta CCMP2712]EKX35187.1 hypothetical protein GUITHDRAFT_146686 [Guillardia theta CCMP2712]|eukprot:XP_005822167.1 hypothetical protein GUITHDRAFT_146686 [Guillardia theta CCMP2712]